MLQQLVVLTLLSLSLMSFVRPATAITYRCDDDQILVVQSFGNDTIRMHCQKPTLCGFQFLKCHYEPLQPYCGGKTNFVAHVQQLTPVGPVTHTCCNLTVNEDLLVPTHIGNDCFLYDLPDGSKGTTAEDVAKEDEEGYMLLKNINKIPEQFEGYSGYRLRLYLLRNKVPSQLVVKGIERNEAGYRVTICRTQCRKSALDEKEQVAHEEQHPGQDKKDGVIDGSGTKRIELTLRNLTDDGRWVIAAWTEWSYKQWSEWSRIQWTEFDKLRGTKLRGNRHRIHQIEADKGTADEDVQNGTPESAETGKDIIREHKEKLRTPTKHKIVVDESEKGVEIPSDELVPGEAPARGNKTRGRKGHRHHGHTSSSECDDDEYYYDEEEDKNEVGHEEQRRVKGHRGQTAGGGGKGKEKSAESGTPENLERGSFSVKTDGVERKTGSFTIGSGEGNKETKSNNGIIEKGTSAGNKGLPEINVFVKTGEEKGTETDEHHAGTSPKTETSVSKVKEDEENLTAGAAQGKGSDKKDISKAKEDEGDDLSRKPEGREGDGVEKTAEEKSKLFEGRKHPALDTVGPEYIGQHAPSQPEKPSVTKETSSKEFVAKETVTSGSSSSSGSKELKAPEVPDGKAASSASKQETSGTASGETVHRTVSETRITTKEEKTKNLVAVGSKETSETNIGNESGGLAVPKTTKSDESGAVTAGKSESAGSDASKAKALAAKVSTETELNAQAVGAESGAQAVGANAGSSAGTSGAGTAADPIAAPAANPALNCFSADTRVYTQKGEKTMKELEVGDFVLVPISKNLLRYERIEMFYHREPETRAKFVVLETESGRKLSLTELHLLPMGDCEAMHRSMAGFDDVEEWLRKSKFAHKARVGDCVLSIAPNHKLQVDRIQKVGRQYLKGIYSPITVEGSIVTDGILASCFSQVESHFGQKLVYDFLISLHRVFGRVMQSLDEPIQHLPSFIDSVHHLSRFVVPFVKY